MEIAKSIKRTTAFEDTAVLRKRGYRPPLILFSLTREMIRTLKRTAATFGTHSTSTILDNDSLQAA